MAVEIVSPGESFVVKYLNRTFGGGPAVDVFKINGKAADGPLGAIIMNAAPIINGATQATSTGFLQTVFTGLAAPGAVTLTGVKVGDIVVSVQNLTTPADASASFEAKISVAGQLQETGGGNLSGSKFLVLVNKQS